jgi:hypothetical protein
MLVADGGGGGTSSPTTSVPSCPLVLLACSGTSSSSSTTASSTTTNSSGSGGGSGSWVGNSLGGAITGVSHSLASAATGLTNLVGQMLDSFPTGITASGQLTSNRHAGDSLTKPWTPVPLGNPSSAAYTVGFYAGLLLSAAGEAGAAGAGAAAENSGDSIAAQLQAHANSAAAKFESGEIGLSPAQARAAAANPGLEATFRGQVIDSAVKEAAARDPNLGSLYITRSGEFGPDFLDLNSVPGIPRWYDVTTENSWLAHVGRYADFGEGTGIFYGGS